MYKELQTRLLSHVRAFLKAQYQVELDNLSSSQPPSVEMGEYALTFCFELAKKLRKPPRKIAEEIVAKTGAIPGIEKLEVAGGGYINARVDRAQMGGGILAGSSEASASEPTPRAEEPRRDRRVS